MLWKETLNSDRHQLHQYQINEQITSHLNTLSQTRLRNITMDIQILVWDRHNHVELSLYHAFV